MKLENWLFGPEASVVISLASSLLSRAASLTNILPYHASSKNVPSLDGTGRLITAGNG